MIVRPLSVSLLLVGAAGLVACAGPDQGPSSVQATVVHKSPDAQTDREFADPGAPGPYGIGLRHIQLEAAHNGGVVLNTYIWYPADIPEGSESFVYLDDDAVGALSGDAVENAPVHDDPEAFPGITFSHGNGGLAYQSIFLTEHLASHGYVVIACDHPGNTMFDYHPKTFITGLFTRPQDISALIDELERMQADGSDPLAGRMDLEHIGMTGHSLGGYTTLAVSGARLNLGAAGALCAQTGDARACAITEEAKRRGASSRLYDLSDPRVIASAPLAPWAWEPFREEGLSYLHLPLQVHGGGLDDTCPMERQIEPVFEYAQPPKSMLEIYRAGHYTYSDMCLLDPSYEDCNDPFIDPDLAHELINSWVTSHFKVNLDGDARYESFLSDEFAAIWAAEVAWKQQLE